jgi:hypothetical protein
MAHGPLLGPADAVMSFQVQINFALSFFSLILLLFFFFTGLGFVLRGTDDGQARLLIRRCDLILAWFGDMWPVGPHVFSRSFSGCLSSYLLGSVLLAAAACCSPK